MAKKTRKKAAAKARKKAKTSPKKKVAVKKKAGKAAAPKKSKPVAKKKPANKTIRTPPSPPPAPESFLRKIEHKIEREFAAVADTLTDAEELHHKLDPGISNEPE